jgi:hypothetical protein
MKDSDEMCAACDGLIPLLLCAGAGTYGSGRQGRIIFRSAQEGEAGNHQQQ